MKNKLKNIILTILKLLYFVLILFICLIIGFVLYYVITSQLNVKNENYKPKISIYTIVSPSMTPVINVYDVVVNSRVDSPEKVEVGDIITYISHAPTSEGMTITHRVVEVIKLPNGSYEYKTQGDNNNEADSLYVPYKDVIGKEIMIIPYLGKLQFLIANQKGWLFLLLIPVVIFIIKDIFHLVELLGLRRKVHKVSGYVEASYFDKKKEERIKQAELKEQLKTEQYNKNAIIHSQAKSEHESNGFLEKYTETIITVNENKYNKKINNAEKKEQGEEILENNESVELIINQSESVEKNPIKKEKKEKVKPVVVNEQYEILDTDELTTKIVEYDKKIEKLDKMLKEMETIQKKHTTDSNEKSSKEDISDEYDFLKERKIKVISTELTKNQKNNKKEKVRSNTKKNKDNIELIDINNTNVIPLSALRKKEKEQEEKIIVEKPKVKKQLKLNPTNVKKINREKKKAEELEKANLKKLKLNPRKVKKINRASKSQKSN